MSAIHSKATRALFAVLALGILITACSSESTGLSDDESGKGSPSVQSDSTKASFGYRLG